MSSRDGTRVLLEALSVSLDPLASHVERSRAFQLIEAAKDLPASDLFRLSTEMVAASDSSSARHFAAKIIERLVSLHWDALLESEAGQVKAFLMAFAGDAAVKRQRIVVEAVADAIVEVAKREWPIRWMELDALWMEIGSVRVESTRENHERHSFYLATLLKFVRIALQAVDPEISCVPKPRAVELTKEVQARAPFWMQSFTGMVANVVSSSGQKIQENAEIITSQLQLIFQLEAELIKGVSMEKLRVWDGFLGHHVALLSRIAHWNSDKDPLISSLARYMMKTAVPDLCIALAEYFKLEPQDLPQLQLKHWAESIFHSMPHLVESLVSFKNLPVDDSTLEVLYELLEVFQEVSLSKIEVFMRFSETPQATISNWRNILFSHLQQLVQAENFQLSFEAAKILLNILQALSGSTVKTTSFRPIKSVKSEYFSEVKPMFTAPEVKEFLQALLMCFAVRLLTIKQSGAACDYSIQDDITESQNSRLVTVSALRSVIDECISLIASIDPFLTLTCLESLFTTRIFSNCENVAEVLTGLRILSVVCSCSKMREIMESCTSEDSFSQIFERILFLVLKNFPDIKSTTNLHTVKEFVNVLKKYSSFYATRENILNAVITTLISMLNAFISTDPGFTVSHYSQCRYASYALISIMNNPRNLGILIKHSNSLVQLLIPLLKSKGKYELGHLFIETTLRLCCLGKFEYVQKVQFIQNVIELCTSSWAASDIQEVVSSVDAFESYLMKVNKIGVINASYILDHFKSALMYLSTLFDALDTVTLDKSVTMELLIFGEKIFFGVLPKVLNVLRFISHARANRLKPSLPDCFLEEALYPSYNLDAVETSGEDTGDLTSTEVPTDSLRKWSVQIQTSCYNIICFGLNQPSFYDVYLSSDPHTSEFFLDSVFSGIVRMPSLEYSMLTSKVALKICKRCPPRFYDTLLHPFFCAFLHSSLSILSSRWQIEESRIKADDPLILEEQNQTICMTKTFGKFIVDTTTPSLGHGGKVLSENTAELVSLMKLVYVNDECFLLFVTAIIRLMNWPVQQTQVHSIRICSTVVPNLSKMGSKYNGVRDQFLHSALFLACKTDAHNNNITSHLSILLHHLFLSYKESFGGLPVPKLAQFVNAERMTKLDEFRASFCTNPSPDKSVTASFLKKYIFGSQSLSGNSAVSMCRNTDSSIKPLAPALLERDLLKDDGNSYSVDLEGLSDMFN